MTSETFNIIHLRNQYNSYVSWWAHLETSWEHHFSRSDPNLALSGEPQAASARLRLWGVRRQRQRRRPSRETRRRPGGLRPWALRPRLGGLAVAATRQGIGLCWRRGGSRAGFGRGPSARAWVASPRQQRARASSFAGEAAAAGRASAEGVTPAPGVGIRGERACRLSFIEC